MPSRAAREAANAFRRAVSLRQVPVSSDARELQTYYHASLAMSVAAWDAYLNAIIGEFYNITANPIDAAFHSLHTIARSFADAAVERFNTPNFENSRALLFSCTGYDPYSDWDWRPRQLGPLQVRDLLNQILRVRHSFAHGFPMPAYPWTRSGGGRVRLTVAGVQTAESLLRYLVSATDRGLRNYIRQAFRLRVRW